MARSLKYKRLHVVFMMVWLVCAAPFVYAIDGQVAEVLYEGEVVASVHAADLEKKYKTVPVPSSGKVQQGVSIEIFLSGYSKAQSVVVDDCRGQNVVLFKDAKVGSGQSFKEYYLVRNKHEDIKLVRAYGVDKKAQGRLKGICEIEIKSSLN